MRTFSGIMEGARAVQDYLFTGAVGIPEDVNLMLRDLVGPTVSPVDTVVKTAEILYARKSEIDAEAAELASGLALLAETYNFHGLAIDERGSRMALALMRDNEIPAPIGIEYPDSSTDPMPQEEYVVVTEE